MRFGCETVVRKACNEDWTVIITEYRWRDKPDTYCRLHIDFADGNNIRDKSFEELCERYGAKEEWATKEYGRRKVDKTTNDKPAKQLTVEQANIARNWWYTFECPTEDDLLVMIAEIINMEEK